MSDLLPIRYYAGVGSRRTPADVRALMEAIGQRLGCMGVELRSGGAGGADTAFEIGAAQARASRSIFLPKDGFNGRRADAALTFVPDEACFERALSMVKVIHPAWDRLSAFAQRLHARNACQVLGLSLASPVESVICWTEGGRLEGGTATAIRLAHKHQIRVFNLGRPQTREAWEAWVACPHTMTPYRTADVTTDAGVFRLALGLDEFQRGRVVRVSNALGERFLGLSAEAMRPLLARHAVDWQPSKREIAVCEEAN